MAEVSPNEIHKRELVAEVGALGAAVVTDELAVTPDRVAEFVEHYVAHVHADDLARTKPEQLLGVIMQHYALARQRSAGTDEVAIFTPEKATHGFDLKGSTVLLVVTDDRPFLVDSVTMEITRQGWSIREVCHPQYIVVRDAAGDLTDVVHRADKHPDGIPESWIEMEIYPPLGKSADELSDALADGVLRVLADVRAATTDWQQMRTRLSEAIDSLSSNTGNSRTDERERAVDLLAWLLNDQFTLLGYREYSLGEHRFEPVLGTGLGILRGDIEPDTTFQALPDPEQNARGSSDLIVFTKDTNRASVHRRTLLDYVGVRVFDDAGRVVGERRFLGVLASGAYAESVLRIPVLAKKTHDIIDRSGYDHGSHGAKSMLAVINTYPRDELFRASAEELYPIVERIAGLTERRRVRLFVHKDPWQRYVSCLVYLPRDRYTTSVRERIQDVLRDAFGAVSTEFQVQVSESVLARLYFVVQLEPGSNPDAVDLVALEGELTRATQSWADGFLDLVHHWPSEDRGVEFPDSYRQEFSPDQGVKDLVVLNSLQRPGDMAYSLDGAHLDDDAADVRLKVFISGRLDLHQVMPHLSRLGVDVVDEWPYEITVRGEERMIYEFGLKLPAGQADQPWTEADRERFVEAFEASYDGRFELGPINALVTRAGLTWEEVSWLRAMERYLKQGGLTYSLDYISAALLSNRELAAELVQAFRTAHQPTGDDTPEARRAAAEVILTGVEQGLEQVSSLDHDRILRAFVALQRAIVRTNAFADRGDIPLAIKLLPRQVELLPQPRPAFEIWVSAPRVEGVHLRFGAVARGGLRWSDRAEDFRTEVLGLVKAQMVKNTVIVPVGAKGGFVARHLPDPAVDRAAWLAEGVESYKLFIRALLSLTDNIVEGDVVPPSDVVRHDADDPYLVVAADKGTASFSDTANAISLEHGFWLGDAFASGGSVGYDHKGMGITARGAWESVKRHFRDMGVDCQTTDFTCVGIGDMSGDVFGNGMLLSKHIRLVAAFDHRHIVIDPDPDAASSWDERSRLFQLPRSSWADYDTSLISAGGGVYARTEKSIPVTAEARRALGLADDVHALTPTDYIHQILQAPVDLLWNGGIGTYVKGSTESHAEVGDRANDSLRVDGGQVRARCAGEGGNLGWTQLGRVEYAKNGGRINTDFIDNSAGVDTSDHEVNIKILLAEQIRAGRLTLEERNELLPMMTDDVAALVLAHNIDQNRALGNAVVKAAPFAGVHEDWMRVLEAAGYLDRKVEYMPSSSEMRRRIANGEGLYSPELATLLAWTKIRLADIVIESDLPDDPYLADRLIQYFPPQLRELFRDYMPEHRLHREIITTVAVNRFVNSQGISSYHRLSNDTGASAADVIRAQLAARAVFGVGLIEVQTARADIDAAVQTDVMLAVRALVERGTRWVLHHERVPIDVPAVVERYGERTRSLMGSLVEYLTPEGQADFLTAVGEWRDRGLSEDLARTMATLPVAHLLPSVVAIADDQATTPDRAAAAFFSVRQRLGLDDLIHAADALPQDDRWGLMAQAATRDELLELQSQLAAQALAGSAALDPGTSADVTMLKQLASDEPDLARLSVALRVLRSMLRT
ncbi:MAG TPA: NAD-glutamate dehydrogenase [Propionibacteriaceae bacterium]|nr:NAD-glutamate dehydrogenase [Propionibacteriaceae bacterium]